MTWCTFVITPLVLALTRLGSGVKGDFIWLEWLVDISWSVEIVLNFFTVDESDRTLRARANSYVRGFFIIDVLSTIPPIITLQ